MNASFAEPLEILVLRFDNLFLRATAPDSNRTGRTILKTHFAIRDLMIQALMSAVPQDMKISIWWSNREGRFCSGRGDEHASQ